MAPVHLPSIAGHPTTGLYHEKRTTKKKKIVPSRLPSHTKNDPHSAERCHDGGGTERAVGGFGAGRAGRCRGFHGSRARRNYRRDNRFLYSRCRRCGLGNGRGCAEPGDGEGGGFEERIQRQKNVVLLYCCHGYLCDFFSRSASSRRIFAHSVLNPGRISVMTPQSTS